MAGVFFNTAAVFDADGKYLGKYRKHHIPHLPSGILGEVLFHAGKCGYPVFETRYARVGVYICYDRHFPKARESWDSTARRSYSILPPPWRDFPNIYGELEQPAHAVANGYFVGASNRVGTEKPWQIGEFYGKSYFCIPAARL